MEPTRRPEGERETLPEHVAQRILARASELDAAQRAAIDVANLRAAAVEAGISPSAFDSALAEVGRGDQMVPTPPRRGGRRIASVLLGAAVAAMLGVITLSRVVPAETLAQESFLLRCLTAGEATELVRPVLGPKTTLVSAPGTAPRIVNVRSTPEDLAAIKAILDARDAAACATPVAPR